MRILAISSNVGDNAPGIVVERFLCELQKTHEVDVLTYDYQRSPDMPGLKNVYSKGFWIGNEKIRRRLTTKLIEALGYDPADELRKRHVLKSLKGGYDVILGFCYGFYMFGQTAGVVAKKRFRAPLVAYYFDAIPSPAGWVKDGLYRRNLGRLVSRGLAAADGILSSNRKMLEYELGFLPEGHRNIPSGYVYTPCVSSTICHLLHSEGVPFVFLFAGSVYGPRKIKYFIGAFAKLLIDHPDCEIWFVGTRSIEGELAALRPEIASKIKVTPRVKDLVPYYEASGALVDIDAELPDDVFLSSKITNYISVDRPIISETGQNSESRRIFAGLETVLQCGHDEDDLYKAMKSVVERTEDYDYSERADLIKTFSLEANTSKLVHFLSSVSE
ncbi:MAG: glycosyltransferase [Bacteroidales bacterium]|nr:glycosyltransferase [Bacteroidales bacterium]